jgi:hypothetical protein
MIEIRAMDESYIHIDCMHGGPVDPSSAPQQGRIWQDRTGSYLRPTPPCSSRNLVPFGSSAS